MQTHKQLNSVGMVTKGYITVLLSEKPEGERINPKGVLNAKPEAMQPEAMKFPYSEVDHVLEFYEMFAEEYGKKLDGHDRGIRSGDWIQMHTFSKDEEGNLYHTIQNGYVGKWQNNIVLHPHCDIICHEPKHRNTLFFLKAK